MLNAFLMRRCAAFTVVIGALIAPRSMAQGLSKTNGYVDPILNEDERKAVRLGPISISLLGAHFWRDWMPVVAKPGPDGGSPLYAKLRFWLQNRGGTAVKLNFSVVIVDAKGQFYPMPHQVLPNFHLLPDTSVAAYRTADPAGKSKLLAEHRVMWDENLLAGEDREVDLALSDGPCLPAGSLVHAQVTWTDAKGASVLVRTPPIAIQRTD